MRLTRRPFTTATAAVLAALAMSIPLHAAEKPPLDESIGDLAQPATNGVITVEGVGLVFGLQGTGSDPSPSWHREKVLTELRRDPEMTSQQAEAILASPNTSLVIVRAMIPTGISPTDELDVEVTLPVGSTTTSLAGGYLMLTQLTQIGIASKGPLEGKPLAKAYGPVLTGTSKDPNDLTAGRVLGGAKVRSAIPYILVIQEKHQSGRTSKRLQELINYRFHQRERGGQTGMAEAKTDKYLELRVPRLYHQNQYRYLQLIRSIRLNSTPELIKERMERWAEELMDPATAGAAAIRLEAAGKNSIPTLKKGLESPSFQVKFFTAEALAYLDDSSGVEVLAEAARLHPEFRLHALAALSATDEAAASVRLRDLMSEADPQVRYGAFDALRTADPTDPNLGHVRVLVPDEKPVDPYALQLSGDAPPPRPEKQLEDPFDLYVVSSDGPPMVHVTRSRRREIVLFGAKQEILLPVVLGGTGPILVNATSRDNSIEVTRLESSKDGVVEQTMTTSADMVELIRTITKLGATYPQVISILESAQKQCNLPGPLLADALPADDGKYDEAQVFGADVVKKDTAVKTAGGEEVAPQEEKTKRPRLMQRLRNRLQGDDKKPASEPENKGV
jgi:flagellar basal body P-ring protein FlgI